MSIETLWHKILFKYYRFSLYSDLYPAQRDIARSIENKKRKMVKHYLLSRKVSSGETAQQTRILKQKCHFDSVK